LTQAVVNGTGAESYSYDAVGNRLTSAGPTSYTYNSSNELTSSSAATYTYDNNGNTISKTTTAGTTSYTWDFENRLASVTLPGTGGTVNFKYDPIGRRIEKVAPTSGTTIYAYDGDSMTAEFGAGGNLLAYYTQGAGIDEPLAITETGGSYFYHADGLGSITSLTSGSGQPANSYVYDSFGNLTASTGSITNPFQYTGRELDSETGLYYYRSRYYDTIAGRFIREDPLRFKAGINYYRYTKNSPVNFADPHGLYALEGFSPTQAAQMSIAIGQLVAKLKSRPCCIDSKLSERVIDLIKPFNYGSGVTFVYTPWLAPNNPGAVDGFDFFTRTVEIGPGAFNGNDQCPLAGMLLHEVIHLTWGNLFGGEDPESGAYGGSVKCFGNGCARPSGM